jgi:hypothetical protein
MFLSDPEAQCSLVLVCNDLGSLCPRHLLGGGGEEKSDAVTGTTPSQTWSSAIAWKGDEPGFLLPPLDCTASRTALYSRAKGRSASGVLALVAGVWCPPCMFEASARRIGVFGRGGLPGWPLGCRNVRLRTPIHHVEIHCQEPEKALNSVADGPWG